MKTAWIKDCEAYIGASQRETEVLSPEKPNALRATFNERTYLSIGDVLPPLFHWLYFQDIVRHDDLKADGHQKMGIFLPPIPLPRRMWAGSSLEFIKPLLLGIKAERQSHIADITLKKGASGLLCFVTVEHHIHQSGALCLIDKHQIVYREANNAPMPLWETEGQGAYHVDAMMLFRYSALTFNTHRIHYDHDYVRTVENYPSVVVHGPLMATMAMRHAQLARPDQTVSAFAFKVLSPVFENEPFDIVDTHQGEISQLSLTKASGVEALKAQVTWRVAE